MIQAINLLLDFLSESRKSLLEAEGKNTITLIGVDMPDSPFTNGLYTFLEPVTQSLHTLTSLNNFEEVMETEHVSELVVEVFLSLKELAKENKFSQFFNAHFKSLIVELCFFFMRATAADLDNIQDDPEEFIN